MTTSPAPLFTLTPTFGVAESISSTLEPAASKTRPPGALISPSFRTVAPISAISPPRLLRSSPWLTIAAGAPGPWVKRKLPASQSALLRLSVEVTSPATLTRALWPNRTPFGLSNQTRPLLLRLPRMAEGSLPVTRLRTWLAAPACSKRTALAAPIEKEFQLMIELGELFTVRVPPTVRAVTWPATGFMPLGRTWARRSAAPGQKLSSEHAVRACTRRRGEVRGHPASARRGANGWDDAGSGASAEDSRCASCA